VAHARCSASAAYRWIACPGSVREAEKWEATSSAAADEGTAAHEEAAGHLLACDDSANPAIQTYLQYVRSRPGAMHVEVKLDPGLQRLHPDMGGTADAVVIGYNALEVIDFKYGQGIVVDAEDNKQLEIYAIGALLTMAPKPTPATTRVTIVQPRVEHMEPIRSWEFDTMELLAKALDYAEAAQATRHPDARLVPGDHCHFCPAAQVGTDGEVRCPALRKARTEMTLASFGEIAIDADPDKVAHALSLVPGLKAMIKSLDALAYQMAINGTPPTGYKLVEKRATRKWAPGAVLPSEYYESVLMSPAQAEKEFGKKVVAKFADQITKQSSGFALVPEDDKRPAVKQIGMEAFALLDGNAATDDSIPPFEL
jgi:hypothetical protein